MIRTTGARAGLLALVAPLLLLVAFAPVSAARKQHTDQSEVMGPWPALWLLCSHATGPALRQASSCANCR